MRMVSANVSPFAAEEECGVGHGDDLPAQAQHGGLERHAGARARFIKERGHHRVVRKAQALARVRGKLSRQLEQPEDGGIGEIADGNEITRGHDKPPIVSARATLTISTSSISTRRTSTRSERAVGIFLPT